MKQIDHLTVRSTASGYVETSSGEGILLWDEIHHWRENGSLILIYLAPKIYHMVPKRIEESGFPINTLKERLVEHVGIAT